MEKQLFFVILVLFSRARSFQKFAPGFGYELHQIIKIWMWLHSGSWLQHSLEPELWGASPKISGTLLKTRLLLLLLCAKYMYEESFWAGALESWSTPPPPEHSKVTKCTTFHLYFSSRAKIPSVTYGYRINFSSGVLKFYQLREFFSLFLFQPRAEHISFLNSRVLQSTPSSCFAPLASWYLKMGQNECSCLFFVSRQEKKLRL